MQSYEGECLECGNDPPVPLVAQHQPQPWATITGEGGYGTAGVRCTCGWSSDTQQPRPNGLKVAWQAYRAHWVEAVDGPPPRIFGDGSDEPQRLFDVEGR